MWTLSQILPQDGIQNLPVPAAEVGGDNEAARDNDGSSDSMDFQCESEVSSQASSASNSNDIQASDEELEFLDEDVESDDASSENEDEGAPPEGDQPLYPGAPLTLHESLLAIFSLACSEHMSGKLLSRILDLIALHCPVNSLCKRSLYHLKKYFSNLGLTILVYHYFCSDCVYPLQSKTSECGKCKKSGNFSFFIEVPLIHQLQALYKRPRFFDDLQHSRNPNRKKNQSNIEDIYDGRIYLEQVANKFLSDYKNISFMWWSDGLKIFKSAVKSSIWPLCLVINELPYQKRILPRNILLAGLWFGKKQPNPNLFLKPLYNSMKSFSTSGWTFKLSNNNQILVKGKILCGTCDLPAKAKFMSCNQFNGDSGCCSCLDPGETYKLEKGSVHVYPYNRNMELRTHEQTKDFAQQAVNRRAAGLEDKAAVVHGVRGPTLLSYLVPDMIKCMAIDIMHGCFLGLCKLLLFLWIEPRFSNCPWSIAASLDVIDSRIRKMNPPCFVQRPLRSIKEALKFWKASEYKLFLLYYSVPVLIDVMDPNYFEHHCKLVSALSLLTQDSISLEQIRTASNLLHEYVSSFAQKYGLRFMRINVHQLLHLPDVVLDLGPLWVYSCFFFESLNGTFGKLFHGTRHVAVQICSSVKLYLEMPVMVENLHLNSPVKRFCQNVTYKKNICKIADQIDESTFAVGTYSTNAISMESSRILLNEFLQKNINVSCLRVFHRLKKNGLMFFSEEYSRLPSSRRDSTFVECNNNGNVSIGRIVRFVKFKDCSPQCIPQCELDCPSQYFCVLREYSRQLWYPQEHHSIRFPHLFKVKPSSSVFIVPITELICLLFYIKVDAEEYVSRPLNLVEVE